jgi:signal recognition particle subunit SRP54
MNASMAKNKAIIYSMTPDERENPGILKASRKQRIAKGAGVKPADVNKLLAQLEQMQTMSKLMSGKKDMSALMRNPQGGLAGAGKHQGSKKAKGSKKKKKKK